MSDRAQALHGPDDVELDLSASEERDALDGGHFEIVPRPYRVLVNNFESGEQGSTVDLALRVDRESALVSGGILERVDPVKKKPARSSSTSTEQE